MTGCNNPGIREDGKLTQEEWEHRCLKGLCYYCGLTINLLAPNCRNTQHPKSPVAGCATFTIMGKPDALMCLFTTHCGHHKHYQNQKPHLPKVCQAYRKPAGSWAYRKSIPEVEPSKGVPCLSVIRDISFFRCAYYRDREYFTYV